MKKGEITQIRMRVPEDRSTGTYDVIKIDDTLYQLANNDPFSETLTYGTIIEVQPKKDDEGNIEFKKIYQESDYTLEVIGLPMELDKSELLIIGQKITDEGGFWEVIFGGLGYVNLPRGSKLNVAGELHKLIQAKREK